MTLHECYTRVLIDLQRRLMMVNEAITLLETLQKTEAQPQPEHPDAA